MNPQLAKHVHQVIATTLDLKERVERGDRVPVPQEQQALRGLLTGPNELLGDPSYSGAGNPRMTAEMFLGAKYALACWIDDIFILDSPLGEEWKADPLEYQLFKRSDAAEGFWQQARLAEQRGGTDALEVFFWCVILGFRGNLVDKPNELRNWVESVKSRNSRSFREEFPTPADRGFVTDVPQLVGEERFGTMVRFVAGAILFSVPVIVFFALTVLNK